MSDAKIDFQTERKDLEKTETICKACGKPLPNYDVKDGCRCK